MPKLKKRADGRYQIQISLGVDPTTGKRRCKTVYGCSPSEVTAKADDLRAKLGRGIDISAADETFSVWRNRWLKSKKGSVCQKAYETLVNCSAAMTEAIGEMPLSRIKPVDVQNVIDELAAQGKAKSTLQKVRNYTDQIFRMAIINRVLEFNPVVAVTVPATSPVSVRSAISDEQQLWIRQMPHRAQTPAMIMLYAGLRRGEVIALHWSDIDLEARTIRVNKSVEMLRGSAHLKQGAKTKAGTRIVDIPIVLADYLSREKAALGSDMDQLVCPSVRGGLMSDTAWRRMWNSYMQDINITYGYGGKRSKFDPNRNKDKPIVMLIEPFTAHQLRHTFATLLYKAGVDPMTAMHQLGHADIKTTLGIYTHLDAEYKRRSMDKLDALLSPADDSAQV